MLSFDTDQIDSLKRRIHEIQERINRAAEKAERDPSTVRLVAVSKTVSVERIRMAIEAGAETFGENYVQEAQDKFSALSALSATWHFIGHLQRNKARYVVRIFDLIHSVDSTRLADELNRQASKINKIQSILIQVNLAGEKTKSGISPEDTEMLVRHVSTWPYLSLPGLMTMPPYFNASEKVRPYFKQLRILRERIMDMSIENIGMSELSMGMTGDFETAVAEGATLVRVGTAIFGARV